MREGIARLAYVWNESLRIGLAIVSILYFDLGLAYAIRCIICSHNNESKECRQCPLDIDMRVVPSLHHAHSC